MLGYKNVNAMVKTNAGRKELLARVYAGLTNELTEQSRPGIVSEFLDICVETADTVDLDIDLLLNIAKDSIIRTTL